MQTTIIERESFLTWKVRARPHNLVNLINHTMSSQEEVFSIWAEWASFYAPGSSQRALLEKVRETRWLVSVVHHDYKRSDALWLFLLDGV